VRGIPLQAAVAGRVRVPRLRQRPGVASQDQGECAACGRQTSVTASTIMHASKLPLTTWFWAAFLMATHSNGISALQLQS